MCELFQVRSFRLKGKSSPRAESRLSCTTADANMATKVERDTAPTSDVCMTPPMAKRLPDSPTGTPQTTKRQRLLQQIANMSDSEVDEIADANGDSGIFDCSAVTSAPEASEASSNVDEVRLAEFEVEAEVEAEVGAEVDDEVEGEQAEGADDEEDPSGEDGPDVSVVVGSDVKQTPESIFERALAKVPGRKADDNAQGPGSPSDASAASAFDRALAKKPTKEPEAVDTSAGSAGSAELQPITGAEQSDDLPEWMKALPCWFQKLPHLVCEHLVNYCCTQSHDLELLRQQLLSKTPLSSSTYLIAQKQWGLTAAQFTEFLIVVFPLIQQVQAEELKELCFMGTQTYCLLTCAN